MSNILCRSCDLYVIEIERLHNELAAATDKVRRIHQAMKRGPDTQDHGLMMNLGCILDHVADASIELATAKVDAARWRHGVAYGFPVKNQTPHDGCRWLAFDPAAISYCGDTPDAAIDAAKEKRK